MSDSTEKACQQQKSNLFVQSVCGRERKKFHDIDASWQKWAMCANVVDFPQPIRVMRFYHSLDDAAVSKNELVRLS